MYHKHTCTTHAQHTHTHTHTSTSCQLVWPLPPSVPLSAAPHSVSTVTPAAGCWQHSRAAPQDLGLGTPPRQDAWRGRTFETTREEKEKISAWDKWEDLSLSLAHIHIRTQLTIKYFIEYRFIFSQKSFCTYIIVFSSLWHNAKSIFICIHTHTHCTCIYHSQNWLPGPHWGGEPVGGNKSGGPIGSEDTTQTYTHTFTYTHTQTTHACTHARTHFTLGR